MWILLSTWQSELELTDSSPHFQHIYVGQYKETFKNTYVLLKINSQLLKSQRKKSQAEI